MHISSPESSFGHTFLSFQLIRRPVSGLACSVQETVWRAAFSKDFAHFLFLQNFNLTAQPTGTIFDWGGISSNSIVSQWEQTDLDAGMICGKNFHGTNGYFLILSIDLQVPFMPLPTVFKLCWHLFTHPLQTIGPIKIQNGEHDTSIAENSEKWNTHVMWNDYFDHI